MVPEGRYPQKEEGARRSIVEGIVKVGLSEAIQQHEPGLCALRCMMGRDKFNAQDIVGFDIPTRWKNVEARDPIFSVGFCTLGQWDSFREIPPKPCTLNPEPLNAYIG